MAAVHCSLAAGWNDVVACAYNTAVSGTAGKACGEGFARLLLMMMLLMLAPCAVPHDCTVVL
jgi:hypothetical protein